MLYMTESKVFLNINKEWLRNDMKKMIFGMVLLIAALIMLLICSFEYKTKYAKTEVYRESSDDERYRLVFYMIGEPEWPFGHTACRVELFDGEKKIIKEDLVMANDGANAGSENFFVTWNRDFITVKVVAEEQQDGFYKFGYDGATEYWDEFTPGEKADWVW